MGNAPSRPQLVRRDVPRPAHCDRADSSMTHYCLQRHTGSGSMVAAYPKTAGVVQSIRLLHVDRRRAGLGVACPGLKGKARFRGYQ